jgi:hypothetical protein
MSLSQFDNVVTQMMAAFGGTGTLRIFSDGAYTDGENVQTTTDYNVKVALFDYPQSNAGEKSQFGTSILAGDKQCFIQPVNKANTCEELEQPEIKANRDVIILNNVEWKIFALKEINSSVNNTIVFEAHLRK